MNPLTKKLHYAGIPLIKFRYCEKATKNWKNLPLCFGISTYLVTSKQCRRFFSNFCGLLRISELCLNQSKFQNAAFCPHIQKWIDFTHWNGIPFKLCSFLVRHSVCFGIICQNPIACPIVIVWHEMEKLQKKLFWYSYVWKKKSPFQRFNRPGRWNVGNTYIYLII